MNKDEDLNVFEVEPSNFCHTALVYNDDGDEVDEHGNTQWVSSAKKSSQDGEYMINPIKFSLPKSVRVVSLILKFVNNLKRKSMISMSEQQSPGHCLIMLILTS